MKVQVLQSTPILCHFGGKADTVVSNTTVERHVGSNPTNGTNYVQALVVEWQTRKTKNLVSYDVTVRVRSRAPILSGSSSMAECAIWIREAAGSSPAFQTNLLA